MSGYDGRGARFPLTIVRGADMAIELTVTSGGSPVNLSAATIAGEVYNTSRTVVTTLTSVVSGAGSNVVTLSATDVTTATLTSTRYSWTLWLTRAGDKRPWLAGQVNVVDGQSGRSGSSGSYSLTVDGNLSVAVDVGAVGPDAQTAANVAIVDAGGYYTGTNVEAALQELPAQYAPLAYARSGTGAPNGVVTGAVGDRYVDTASTLGARVWYKASGAGDTGWLVAEGDTGWRQLATSDMQSDWRGSNSTIRLKRVGDMVYVALYCVPTVPMPPDPASSTMVTIPSGFRPNSGSYNNGSVYPDMVGIVASDSTGAQIRLYSSGAIDVVLGPYLSNANRVVGLLTLATSDAWPASLPGSAV